MSKKVPHRKLSMCLQCVQILTVRLPSCHESRMSLSLSKKNFNRFIKKKLVISKKKCPPSQKKKMTSFFFHQFSRNCLQRCFKKNDIIFFHLFEDKKKKTPRKDVAKDVTTLKPIIKRRDQQFSNNFPHYN